MMMTSWSQLWCIVGLCLMGALSVFALPRMPMLADGLDNLDFNVRGSDGVDAPKPETRDNGIGSLLLKNLRFRDLASRNPPMTNLLSALRHQRLGGNEVLDNAVPEMLQGSSLHKRSGVSVSKLAELLHNLRSRGIEDDGVKLQSLRFGK